MNVITGINTFKPPTVDDLINVGVGAAPNLVKLAGGDQTAQEAAALAAGLYKKDAGAVATNAVKLLGGDQTAQNAAALAAGIYDKDPNAIATNAVKLAGGGQKSQAVAGLAAGIYKESDNNADTIGIKDIATNGVKLLGGDETAQSVAGLAASAYGKDFAGVATQGVKLLGGDEVAQNAVGVVANLASQNYVGAGLAAVSLVVALAQDREPNYPNLWNEQRMPTVPPNAQEGHKWMSVMNEHQQVAWTWDLYRKGGAGLEAGNWNKVVALTGATEPPPQDPLVFKVMDDWGLMPNDAVNTVKGIRNRNNRVDTYRLQGYSPEAAEAKVVAEDNMNAELERQREIEYAQNSIAGMGA